MLLIYQLEVPVPNLEDASSVKSMLLYFTSLLLIILILVLRYTLKQNKVLLDGKDDIIDDKNDAISKLEVQLKDERDYIKSIGNSVTEAIGDNNNILKGVVLKSDKTNTDISEYIKPTVKSNNELIKNVANHVSNFK